MCVAVCDSRDFRERAREEIAHFRVRVETTVGKLCIYVCVYNGGNESGRAEVSERNRGTCVYVRKQVVF